MSGNLEKLENYEWEVSRIPVNDLKVGMEISQSVFNGSKTIPVVAQGVQITPEIITRLKKKGITIVPIRFQIAVESKPKVETELTQTLQNFQEFILGDHKYEHFFTSEELTKKVEEAIKDSYKINNLHYINYRLRNHSWESYSHSLDVAILNATFANYLNKHEKKGSQYYFRKNEIVKITAAGLTHDTGKIGILEQILHKPGKLEPEEMNIMKEHPILGFEKIMKKMNNMYLAYVAAGHHCFNEDINDTNCYGYFGEDVQQIDKLARDIRITTITDVFSALTTLRPYRTPELFTPEQAIEIMNKMNQFDKNLLTCFYYMFKEANQKPFIVDFGSNNHT